MRQLRKSAPAAGCGLLDAMRAALDAARGPAFVRGGHLQNVGVAQRSIRLRDGRRLLLQRRGLTVSPWRTPLCCSMGLGHNPRRYARLPPVVVRLGFELLPPAPARRWPGQRVPLGAVILL